MSEDLETLQNAAAEYDRTRPKLSQASLDTYAKFGRWWEAYCLSRGADPDSIEPDVLLSVFVGAATGDLSVRGVTLSPSAVDTFLATIRNRHRDAGKSNPFTRDPQFHDRVKRLRKGYVRWHLNNRARTVRKRASLTPPEIEVMASWCTTQLGKLAEATNPRALDRWVQLTRLRAMLLVGWHLGLLPRQLLPMTKADVSSNEGGLSIRLMHAGREAEWILRPSKNPDLDAVAALNQWLTLRESLMTIGMDAGPLWNSLARGTGQLHANHGIDPMTWRFNLNMAAEACQLGAVSPMDLRRSFSAMLYSQGATDDDVQQALRLSKPEGLFRHRPASLSGEVARQVLSEEPDDV